MEGRGGGERERGGGEGGLFNLFLLKGEGLLERGEGA